MNQKSFGERESSSSREVMGVQESYCLVLTIQTHAPTLTLEVFTRNAFVLTENGQKGHRCIYCCWAEMTGSEVKDKEIEVSYIT